MIMKKNTLFVIITTLAVISFSFMSYSYAQSESSKISIPHYGVLIFVQTIVENSEGQIVTYLASDKFTDVNSKSLNSLLDSEANEKDPIVSIGDEKYQVITRKQTIDYDKKNVIASTIMAQNQNGDLKQIARFAHDGYPIVEGDRVVSIWTFIRPVE